MSGAAASKAGGPLGLHLALLLLAGCAASLAGRAGRAVRNPGRKLLGFRPSRRRRYVLPVCQRIGGPPAQLPGNASQATGGASVPLRQ